MEKGLIFETQDLSKRYGKSSSLALDNLSISLFGGEIYGFLGPNGAGKSTTIRLLMDFIKPSSGKATILGKEIGTSGSDSIRSKIGYLSGDFAIYPKLTGSKFLNYLSEMSGKNNQKTIRNLAKVLDVDLEKPLGSLSKGNRQKIGIIQAIMGDPEVLILDEPTTGLDPLKQEVFYKLIRNARDRGAGVFISSHNLSEVHKICDRLGIIRQGKLVYQGDISGISVEASHQFDVEFRVKPSIRIFKNIKEIRSITPIGKELRFVITGDINNFLKTIAKYDVLRLESSNLELEDQFMQFYEDNK